MESQPQNPEFRNNSENFQTYTSALYPLKEQNDMTRCEALQSILFLFPTCLTLCILMDSSFWLDTINLR